MWDIFEHFLLHVVGEKICIMGTHKGLHPDNEPFWFEQLCLLNQGIRDGRIHDNSRDFVSWYEANWGEFLVGEVELWWNGYVDNKWNSDWRLMK